MWWPVFNRYKLVLTGKEFNLNDSDGSWANINITKGDYTTRQRHSVATVGNEATLGTGATTINDIVVKIDSTTLTPTTHYTYDVGSRNEVSFVVSASSVPADIQRVDPNDSTGAVSTDTVFTGDVNIALPIALATENIELFDLSYPHLDVFVNGNKLLNTNFKRQFTSTTTQLTIHNVNELPGGSLKSGATILLVASKPQKYPNKTSFRIYC